MDAIYAKLKLKNKSEPAVWNLSVEITQKILGQNEIYPKIQNDYHCLKAKHQIAKKISSKAYVESCFVENKRQIEQLEKSVIKLKEQFQHILIEKKDYQEKIEENEKKKNESEKKNDKLISEIEKMNKKIVKIELSIDELNSKINEKNGIIESLDNTIQAEQRIVWSIEQMKNKSKKVHFPEPYNSPKVTGKSMERYSSTPKFIEKPNFSKQALKQRSLSFSSSQTSQSRIEPKSSQSSEIRNSIPILPNGCITAIAFSKTVKIFAIGSEDYAICLYEYEKEYPIESVKMSKSIVSLDFNSSNNLFLVTCYDTIHIFDLIKFSLRARPDKIIIEKIYHTEFISPDKFAVCSENFAIRIYKVTKKGAKLKTSLRPRISSIVNWICSGTVSNGLAAGYESGTIRIWDPRSGKITYECSVHQSPIIQIGCYGKYFVSLSPDGCISFTNMLSHVIERKIYLKGCSLHEKTRMTIFNNSILLGGDDGLIHEYSLKDGKFIAKWDKFHESSITAISANKFCVVSGDKNGKIKVWNSKQ